VYNAACCQDQIMPDDTTRWTVSVSKQTDISVRSVLAERGMEGDFSGFIEDALRWRVPDRKLAEARGAFADLPPQELEALLNEAFAATRHGHLPKAG